MADKEKTDGKKDPKRLPSLKGHPAVAGFPSWLLDMPPHDIMSLPFDDLSYTDDFFEMALVVLALRGWSYDKIHFYHHVVLTPVLWPFFFKKPIALTQKLVGIRWAVLTVMFCLFTAAIYFIAKGLDTPVIFSLVIGLGGISVLLINTFIGMEYFTKWRMSFHYLGKDKLTALLPKKIKLLKK